MADPADNSGGAARRPDGMPVGRPFQAGGPSANPGGKPKKLRDIEKMLDDEHRTVDNMREVFGRLKALALGELVTVTDQKTGAVDVELDADPAFMKLYLDRVLGPVKELEADLADAPPEVLEYLRNLR